MSKLNFYLLCFILQAPDHWDPGEYVGLIYRDRMRHWNDKQQVLKLYSQVFETTVSIRPNDFHLTSKHIQVGQAVLVRKHGKTISSGMADKELALLHHNLPTMESLLHCLDMNWMAILV